MMAYQRATSFLAKQSSPREDYDIEQPCATNTVKKQEPAQLSYLSLWAIFLMLFALVGFFVLSQQTTARRWLACEDTSCQRLCVNYGTTLAMIGGLTTSIVCATSFTEDSQSIINWQKELKDIEDRDITNQLQTPQTLKDDAKAYWKGEVAHWYDTIRKQEKDDADWQKPYGFRELASEMETNTMVTNGEIDAVSEFELEQIDGVTVVDNKLIRVDVKASITVIDGENGPENEEIDNIASVRKILDSIVGLEYEETSQLRSGANEEMVHLALMELGATTKEQTYFIGHPKAYFRTGDYPNYNEGNQLYDTRLHAGEGKNLEDLIVKTEIENSEVGFADDSTIDAGLIDGWLITRFKKASWGEPDQEYIMQEYYGWNTAANISWAVPLIVGVCIALFLFICFCFSPYCDSKRDKNCCQRYWGC